MTVEKEENTLFVAMVVLRQASVPAVKDVIHAFKQLWNEETAEEFADDSTFGFDTSEGQIICGLIPAPLPWRELEGPCATSPFWRDAANQMKGHKAHIIVTASPGDGSPIIGFRLLTKAVAAILQTQVGIGVYWGTGTLVNPPEVFLEHAARMSDEYLPLYLWIDFRVMPDKGGTLTLFTNGMAALGFMEIEIVQSQLKPFDAVDMAFNIAHYLLDNGPVLGHGDTIGMSAEQKIMIRHVPSIFEGRGIIYQLEP